MKKGILIGMSLLIAFSLFTGCGKLDSTKADDAYYAYVTEKIENDTVTIKGYNGAPSELQFEIPVEKWEMSQFEAGSYIKIIVNAKDEILEINKINESDVVVSALSELKTENK